mmetsp:Transcript_40986/g.110070  ORF Transcript_40986/g.110070 Transcript_40986/m.110070 type:complete len:311 (+) Transcript_40986:274-1206(+)
MPRHGSCTACAAPPRNSRRAPHAARAASARGGVASLPQDDCPGPSLRSPAAQAAAARPLRGQRRLPLRVLGGPRARQLLDPLGRRRVQRAPKGRAENVLLAGVQVPVVSAVPDVRPLLPGPHAVHAHVGGGMRAERAERRVQRPAEGGLPLDAVHELGHAPESERVGDSHLEFELVDCFLHGLTVIRLDHSQRWKLVAGELGRLLSRGRDLELVHHPERVHVAGALQLSCDPVGVVAVRLVVPGGAPLDHVVDGPPEIELESADLVEAVEFGAEVDLVCPQLFDALEADLEPHLEGALAPVHVGRVRVVP